METKGEGKGEGLTRTVWEWNGTTDMNFKGKVKGEGSTRTVSEWTRPTDVKRIEMTGKRRDGRECNGIIWEATTCTGMNLDMGSIQFTRAWKNSVQDRVQRFNLKRGTSLFCQASGPVESFRQLHYKVCCKLCYVVGNATTRGCYFAVCRYLLSKLLTITLPSAFVLFMAMGLCDFQASSLITEDSIYSK